MDEIELEPTDAQLAAEAVNINNLDYTAADLLGYNDDEDDY